MTVGELICELKKYDQTSLVMFVSRSDDSEFVRLILLDDLKISKVFLAPHGERGLLAGELASRLNKLGFAFSGSEVFFLTQARESAKIYRVGVSDENEYVILSGEN